MLLMLFFLIKYGMCDHFFLQPNQNNKNKNKNKNMVYTTR